MAIDKDTKIFDDVSFATIAKEIYEKKKEKDVTIQKLISDLSPLIKTVSDAGMLVPLLKEYLDTAVRNDDNLVKLAAIVQKLIVADKKIDGDGDGWSLSDADKKQLLIEAEEIRNKMITEASK
jgi:hypothetical protein